MKGCMSAHKAAYGWDVSTSRVHSLCQAGRVPGRTRFGRSRAVPDDREGRRL